MKHVCFLIFLMVVVPVISRAQTSASCPVVIEHINIEKPWNKYNGNRLDPGATQKHVLLFDFKNTSGKTIIARKFKVFMFDGAGEMLEVLADEREWHLQLGSVIPDGAANPTPVKPNKKDYPCLITSSDKEPVVVSKVRIMVSKVMFEDGTTWKSKEPHVCGEERPITKH